MADKYITLTWSFIRDKHTTMQEKLILMEINNLSMLERGCVAGNEHFSVLMGIKKEAVSRLISSLEKKGYIKSEIRDGSRNFDRKITINKLLFDHNKLLFDHKQNVIDPLTKCLETKGNITKNITKDNKDLYVNKKNKHSNIPIPKDIDPELWKAWMQVRKSKKAINNEIAITALLHRLDECEKHGYSKNFAIKTAIEESWKSVKFDWIDNLTKTNKKTSEFAGML